MIKNNSLDCTMSKKCNKYSGTEKYIEVIKIAISHSVYFINIFYIYLCNFNVKKIIFLFSLIFSIYFIFIFIYSLFFIVTFSVRNYLQR